MKIREELIPERRSYALDTPESGTDLLNCSMGENPLRFPGLRARGLEEL